MGRGSRQTYWALVESYRTPRGSRQRVVAYLGKLQRSQASGWDQLSQRVSGRMPEPPGLFDEALGDQDSADVDLKGLRLERVRDFGDVYLGHYLYQDRDDFTKPATATNLPTRPAPPLKALLTRW